MIHSLQPVYKLLEQECIKTSYNAVCDKKIFKISYDAKEIPGSMTLFS